MRTQINIREFKHRVALCSMKDVVEEGGIMTLTRQDVYHCWAKITVYLKSLFSKEGYSIKQNENDRTHHIFIRNRRDIDITSAAWVYEERLQSPPRWFKVIGIFDQSEDGEYIAIDARLVEKSMDISPPVEANKINLKPSPLPTGVEL